MNTREQTPSILDPIRLPLTGSRLIEASAGTGKTFTIALLYVRLVLGPRDEADTASFPRALTPPEILVVTFTNAATRELRDRIRARLVEAAEAFQSPLGGQTPESTEGSDPLLALRDSYPEARRPACARRLRLAAGQNKLALLERRHEDVPEESQNEVRDADRAEAPVKRRGGERRNRGHKERNQQAPQEVSWREIAPQQHPHEHEPNEHARGRVREPPRPARDAMDSAR